MAMRESVVKPLKVAVRYLSVICVIFVLSCAPMVQHSTPANPGKSRPSDAKSDIAQLVTSIGTLERGCDFLIAHVRDKLPLRCSEERTPILAVYKCELQSRQIKEVQFYQNIDNRSRCELFILPHGEYCFSVSELESVLGPDFVPVRVRKSHGGHAMYRRYPNSTGYVQIGIEEEKGCANDIMIAIDYRSQ